MDEKLGVGKILTCVAVALIVGALGGWAMKDPVVERVEVPGQTIQVPGPVQIQTVEKPVLTEAVTVGDKTYGESEVKDLLSQLEEGTASTSASDLLESLRVEAEDEVTSTLKEDYRKCGNVKYKSSQLTSDFDNDYSIDVEHDGDLTFQLSGNVDYDDKCDKDFTATVVYDESRNDFNVDVTLQ